MKITVLTMFYNEEKIAPYFLTHYRNIDEILVLLETDTDDRTEEICKSFPNVKIRYCHIEGGINDRIKKDIINQIVNCDLDSDWVYVVDSDELIFPPNNYNAYDFLSLKRFENSNVLKAELFQVYRHRTEFDLNLSKPIISQRIHGDLNTSSEEKSEHRDKNSQSIKPIVIRPRTNTTLQVGNHFISGGNNVPEERFFGAHWQMADVEIAIQRRMDRKRRISRENRINDWGFQHFNVTEEWIREECERHLDDPIIPILKKYDNFLEDSIW